MISARALICDLQQATVAPFVVAQRSGTVSTSRKPRNFEKAFNELEAVVERLENDDLSLEEALKTFETGVQLTRECQQALTQARQRVQLLTEQGDGLRAKAFAEAASDGGLDEEEDDSEDQAADADG